MGGAGSTTAATGGSGDAQGKVTMRVGAVAQMKKLLKAEPNRHLRLRVNSGGCAGYQYEFVLEPESRFKEDEDIVACEEGESGEIKLVIDSLSLDFLESCEIDFTSEMIRSSFQVVANKSAENSCGCGASFSTGGGF